jgi:hypothetical protein
VQGFEPVRTSVAVLLVVLAGCGGKAAAPPSPFCVREAGRAADNAARILRYYGPGQVYPADVAYLSFRRSISLFEEGDCDPAVLGKALKRRLTARQRAELLTHLPATLVRSVEGALAAAD